MAKTEDGTCYIPETNGMVIGDGDEDGDDGTEPSLSREIYVCG